MTPSICTDVTGNVREKIGWFPAPATPAVISVMPGVWSSTSPTVNNP